MKSAFDLFDWEIQIQKGKTMITSRDIAEQQQHIASLESDLAAERADKKRLQEQAVQYRSDLEKMDMEIERIGIQHQEEVKALNEQIANLRKDLNTSLETNRELLATAEDYQETFRMIVEVIERTSSTRYDESFPYAALVRSLADNPLRRNRDMNEIPF